VFFVPAALICDKIRKMYEFFCEKINMFAENRQDFYREKGNSNKSNKLKSARGFGRE